MHIKRMHEMIGKLTECALSELNKGAECVSTEEFGCVVDMIKDLADAEYKARVSKAMEEAEEEEKAEEKYMLQRFKEEYGEEDGERRYYDNYRYANGRFAPKGRGTYRTRSGRRGFGEPVSGMAPEIYYMYPAEYYRDMDRRDGKMYFSGGGQSGGNMSTQSDGISSGNSTGSGSTSTSRGYSEGYSDGNRHGYEEGYSEGERRGRSSQSRDSREGRSGRSRRSYMETKEVNKGNSAQEKQRKMKELENYMGELGDDISEMIMDATPEEKTLLKNKLQTLAQKVG